LHEQPLLLLVRLLVNEHNAANRLSLLMQEDGLRACSTMTACWLPVADQLVVVAFR
jgi:hypothetical protein